MEKLIKILLSMICLTALTLYGGKQNKIKRFNIYQKSIKIKTMREQASIYKSSYNKDEIKT